MLAADGGSNSKVKYVLEFLSTPNYSVKYRLFYGYFVSQHLYVVVCNPAQNFSMRVYWLIFLSSQRPQHSHKYAGGAIVFPPCSVMAVVCAGCYERRVDFIV